MAAVARQVQAAAAAAGKTILQAARAAAVAERPWSTWMAAQAKPVRPEPVAQAGPEARAVQPAWVEPAAAAASDVRTHGSERRTVRLFKPDDVDDVDDGYNERWLRVYSSTTFATNSASSPSTTRKRRDISRATFRTSNEYERKSRR